MSIIGNPSQTTSHFCEKSHELNNTADGTATGEGAHVQTQTTSAHEGRAGEWQG